MREESWPRFLKPLAGIIDRTMREEKVGWGSNFASFWNPFGVHFGFFWHPFNPFWRPKSLLGVPREGTGKLVFKKTRHRKQRLQNVSKMGPKWDAQIAGLVIFVGDIFQFFPVSFLGWILNCFLDGSWIEFRKFRALFRCLRVYF
jgi:hypothetical protein